VEWVVREGVGAGGKMTQVLYAHMNNKTIKKKDTQEKWSREEESEYSFTLWT
jgi:hypothetical protein